VRHGQRFAGSFRESRRPDVSNSKQRYDWKKRANEAASDLAARAVASVPDVGLAYSHMSDLVEIASRHWAPLRPALGDEAVMVPMLAQFESLRNTRGNLLIGQELHRHQSRP